MSVPYLTRCGKNFILDTLRRFCYLIPSGKEVLITDPLLAVLQYLFLKLKLIWKKLNPRY